MRTSSAKGNATSQLRHAVVWRGSDGAVHKGRLDLGEDALRLTGTGPKAEFADLKIPYADLTAIHIGRATAERVNGTRSLVVESEWSGPVHIASVEGPGSIFEIGDLLAELKSEQTHRTSCVAVVVPLKPGSAEKARSLVRAGPPFDPGARFQRHHVFVDEFEVVFVFEGEDVERGVRGLARSTTVWKAAAAWRECLGGPPRLADEDYSWPRREADTGAGERSESRVESATQASGN